MTDERKAERKNQLLFNLMEKRFPYFDDTEIDLLLERNKYDVDKASYEGLLIKAEATGIDASGLVTKDSSGYFKMLASHYVPTNSGVLT